MINKSTFYGAVLMLVFSQAFYAANSSSDSIVVPFEGMALDESGSETSSTDIDEWMCYAQNDSSAMSDDDAFKALAGTSRMAKPRSRVAKRVPKRFNYERHSNIIGGKTWEALRKKIEALRKCNKFDAVSALLDKVNKKIETKPNPKLKSKVLYELCLTYAAQGNADEAEKVMRSIVNMNGADAPTKNNAHVFITKQDFYTKRQKNGLRRSKAYADLRLYPGYKEGQ